MRLAAGEFSLDGLAGFQRNTLLNAWRCAALINWRLPGLRPGM
jgi:hypothetical protein